MTRISLNVIVYNEEARLAACLEDARAHVDEIVVVDQMSTDGTAEIAQRLADVYIRDVHHGHAEPSRELAASRSSGDWLLILDADELLSDLLKRRLRDLVEGDADGYWIRKRNLVGDVDTGTVLHYRLARKSRVRFDPGPHGGAVPVSDNAATFDEIGIIHEKTVDEQLFDDARYDQMALEEDAPGSAKRNWLMHNIALREERARRRRTDLEALVPRDACDVLVLGDVRVELGERAADAIGDPVDAVIIGVDGDNLATGLRDAAHRVRTGGAVVGTVAAARNRRHLEHAIGAVLSDEAEAAASAYGTTRHDLSSSLAAAGLDVRWLDLVRDRWLDPVPLRPDGSAAIVEAEHFLLKGVSADVAEELTAEEIVFVAVRRAEVRTPPCSVIVAELPGTDAQAFARALREAEPDREFELTVVGTDAITGEAGLAALLNVGARASTGDVLVFVSSDATPDPGWLPALLDAYASRPDTGAVGSKIVAADGTIDHAGLALGGDRVPYRIYQGEAAATPHVDRPRLVPAVVSLGMATSRADFAALGGFDEALGDELADADYCLRLRARGRPILYAPGAVLSATARALPGTRGAFTRSARQFAGRWTRAVRSDEVVCATDHRDINWERGRAWRLPRPSVPRGGAGPAVAWTSHFLERGGYTEEAIAAVEALDAAGIPVVANPVTWTNTGPPRPPDKAARLAELLNRDLRDDFVHVAHIGANRFKRHADAMRNVGRTMFETDSLPADWRDQCNRMDEVWVPSEHNLHAFANAGVKVSKLHKVPETFDTDLFRPGAPPLSVEGVEGFVFLSLFSWSSRKAWDVLLRAWYEEFRARDDVTLLLKTDIDQAPGTDCRSEVEWFARGQLGVDPAKGPRIVVLDTQLGSSDVPSLYATADAFVLPSHGEGWGRPHMEAMAMELPTIATRWSGNLEFMNDDNSYLVDYELVDASPAAWMSGHRWAAPSIPELRRAMRRVYEHRGEAAATGKRARADVLVSCRPELVVDAVRERLNALDRHPVHVPVAPAASPAPARRQRAKDGRRITACVVVHENAPPLSQCLASVEGIADSLVVVDAKSDEDDASARNDALDQATGSWVLMLDATQTLDPASTSLVLELASTKEFVGFTARERHHLGLDGAVSTVEDRSPVLFPRHPDVRYVGSATPQLVPLRRRLGFRLAPSGIVLYQHDYRPDRFDSLARSRRDLPALERAARDAPDEPFHLYSLGTALDRLGLHAEAEVALRDAIARAEPDTIWSASAYVSLAQTVRAQGRAPEAVKLLKAATKVAPEWAEGWCRLGTARLDTGKLKGAHRAFERALQCAQTGPLGAPLDAEWHAQAGIGRVHLARGEYDAAIASLTVAIGQNPGSVELRMWYAQACEAVGRAADARRQLEMAMASPHAGADAFAAFGDFFVRKAEDALLRGLAENAESRVLQERLEQLRAARAMR